MAVYNTSGPLLSTSGAHFDMNSTESLENVSHASTPFSMWDLPRWNQYIFERNMLPSFVFILLLLIIGVPGNSLVCYIYHFKIRNRKLSSNIFILALSWLDLINCALTLPFELFVISNYVQFDNPIICKFARFISFFCNNATSVILLSIAIDRLRVFMSGPRRLRLQASTSNLIVGLAMVISAFISWPMLLFFGTWRFSLPNGVTGEMCLITNYYMLNNHPVEAFTWTLLTVHLIFDVLFVIIYSVIGKRICIDTKATRSMSASSEHAHSFRVDFRKGSDSSAEDDVFTMSTSSTRKSSIRQIDDHISSEDTLYKFNLLNSQNSQNSSVTSIPSSPKKVLLRPSLSKHNSRILSSPFKKQQSRCSATNSEWMVSKRRPVLSRTSIMLFLVTVAYMITYLPYCILVVIRTTDSMFFFRLNDLDKSFFQLFFRSYCLGSAINPIIYSFVSSSFRKKCREALYDILCCLPGRKRKKTLN
ncbi:cholecystokinin receptor type A-like isoform X1 [Mytilus edulis]|uniref:cholecystokinin receptor type A-like isoform X1 n=2 Tax=Mytilus edulis TaxID=6550 RepID=UPI0039EF87C4